MKLWLDDIRPAPDASWTHCRTQGEASHFLRTGLVEEISFDHDLGENAGDGYSLAKEIEKSAAAGNMRRPLVWHIHSANPVGRANIQAAMESHLRFF